MTNKVHLEGMGVMGSMIANFLKDDGIDFTWHDTDEMTVQSWRASTGAIMPFGDRESIANLGYWKDKIADDTQRWYAQFIRPARYMYVSGQPPHGARRFGVRSEAQVGPIHISNQHSLHMNVQEFVKETRLTFASRRLSGPPAGGKPVYVVTHGWGNNNGGYSWGWSAKVEVEWDRTILDALDGDRPMLYGRKGFQLPYLYPVGKSKRYYAGTTLITQKVPSHLDIDQKFDTWSKHIEEYTEGLVVVSRLMPGTLMEAWRPMAREGAPMVHHNHKDHQHKLWLRPQYGNGIRLFPETYAILKQLIEEFL